ncbi:hypothetical protein [Pseudomonas sp. NA-150]|uniref:hypothetical protein n=1 Tax=Pseudomonas sp. NA-150 TaxID=3367525 RepID=UPI0037C6EBC5
MIGFLDKMKGKVTETSAGVRNLYLSTLTPRSAEFIDEKFSHEGRSLSFTCFTGEVLASDQGYRIRRADGVEKPVRLLDSNLPICEGQVVSLMCCSADDNPNSALVALINHTASSTIKVLGAGQINKRFSLIGQDPQQGNARDTREKAARLLNELEIRLSQLGEWASRFEAPGKH